MADWMVAPKAALSAVLSVALMAADLAVRTVAHWVAPPVLRKADWLAVWLAGMWVASRAAVRGDLTDVKSVGHWAGYSVALMGKQTVGSWAVVKAAWMAVLKVYLTDGEKAEQTAALTVDATAEPMVLLSAGERVGQ